MFRVFCNVPKTPKKAIIYNKPENKMTKAEKLKFASKFRYR